MKTEANTAAPEGCAPPSCSRSLVSESKIEEIIACLWSLMWVILWVNHAPQWMLWAVGLKAASDHLCAVIFAISKIRRENATGHTTADNSTNNTPEK